MKRYVVKQQGNGDWIAIDAASPSEAAKKAARCWGLSGNAWLLVAEGKDGFSHGEFEIYTASGEKIDFTVEVREREDQERPCNCGSGVPWPFCQANSPYCG